MNSIPKTYWYYELYTHIDTLPPIVNYKHLNDLNYIIGRINDACI